jgi:hypothetical protein
LLAIRAVATSRQYDSHDGVANPESVGNPASHLVDDPSRLHSRHVRRRVNFLMFGARAVPGQDVGWVDCGSVDTDPHLSRTSVNLRQFHHLKNFGTAMSE